MIEEKYSQFLLKRTHADLIKHSGRSLYEHLCGTHDLLREWGNSEPVCLAGLFHSVYGTKHFRAQAWSILDRATIQHLIGLEAELLAFTFCVSDRPKAFFANADGFLTPSLREIEAANLLEQGSSSRWLQRLRDSDISDGAKRAIDERLEEEAA